MNEKVVVSFADDSGNYSSAIERLESSLGLIGYDGEFLGFRDYEEIGSPPHKGQGSVPYAFKAHSIRKCIDSGFRYILWCDSVVYATAPLDNIFNQIKSDGYLFFDNIGYSVGDYTSDACLDYYGMTRQEAFKTKMIMACVMGFDTHNEKAAEFLDKYIDAAINTDTYQGAWTNSNQSVSKDRRVRGHRHDQSVASILINNLGLTITNAQSTHFAYVSHKGYVPISESVCLWSEGI